jgi:hexosaminidase
MDTPGHTDILAESHPEHVACNQKSPWATYANGILSIHTFTSIDLTHSTLYLTEPPAGQLRFTNPATVTFVTNLLSAIAKLFPSKYFSTGGDELNQKCYADDQQTQQELKATGETLDQALSKFTVSTHTALIAEGKTPVVWEGLFAFRLIGVDRNFRRPPIYFILFCRDGTCA